MKFGLRRMLLVAVLGILVGAQGCQDEGSKATEHLTRAEEFLEANSFDEAIIEFRNVLQLDPKHLKGHYGLAKAYFGAKKVAEGYWWLGETIRLDPENWSARLEYGEISRLGGEYEVALEQAEAVIEGDPDQTDAYVLKARALEGLERMEEAREFYLLAIERDPATAVHYLRLATFLLKLGEREEAEGLFREAVGIEPSSLGYFALAGYLAADLERLDEAEVAYRLALEHSKPEEAVFAHRVLANFYYSQDRFDEAEATLIQGLERAPDDLDLVYLLARFYRSQGDQKKADMMMEEATRARPDEVRPQLVLSLYRHRLGDFEGALAASEAAITVDPTDRSAQLRKAELLIEKGYREDTQEPIAAGRSMIDAVLAREPSSPEALYLQAKLHLAAGESEEAIAGFRRVVEAKPDWAQPHLLLGTALFQEGDLHGARAELSRSLELDGSLAEARKILARVHSRLGETDFAIEEGKRALKDAPEDVELRVMLAQSLLRAGKRKEAREVLLELSDKLHDAQSLYALGRIYYLDGDLKPARRYLKRANREKPDNPRIVEALLDLDRREGRVGDSKKRIEEALAANPDEGSLYYLRGLVSLLGGDATGAENDFRRSIQLAPNDMRAYQGLATILAQSGRRQEIIHTYEKALEEEPEGAAGLYLMVGTLYEMSGQQLEAVKRYEQALERDPNLAPAKNNLAYLLAETGGDLDQALELAQGAKEQLPDDPNVADTLGWVLYKKGIASAAITYLQEAEARMPTGDPALGMVRYHLALAFEADGDRERARETVDKALEGAAASAKAQGRVGSEGETVIDPDWVLEARALRERLNPGAGGAQAG